ncbi:SCNN1D [Bugula neritina]|uniref:SCNN1D n=2 Tax=Bugula neritina TaxID=10212 RepID=A0A7J7JWP3_BUGNE|nr:SCNN1D [Bugula neritina]
MSLKPTLSRTAKMKMYGFSLPADLVGEVSEEDITGALIGQAFCDNTTSHGIPHTYRAASQGKRAAWFILSLLSVGALSFHLSQLISVFIQFDTSTDIKLNNDIRSLAFPAVTICNNNMIRSSAITSALNTLVSTASNKQDRAQAKHDILEDLAYEYALLEDDDIKFQLGHQFESLVQWADFNYEDVADDFIHFFNPYHGNCFTFNHFSDSNKSSSVRAGAEYGLVMLLNIQQYEYVPYLTEASGVKILIHDPEEMPFPEDGGITVAPNTRTRLAVKRTEYTRKNGRYGNCLEVGEDDFPLTIYNYQYGYSYSKPACEKSCVQEQAIKECGCFLPEIPYNESFYSDYDAVKPCDGGNSSVCVEEIYYNFTSGSLKCENCHEPCHEVVFDVTPSATVWPAPSYMGDLKDTVQSDMPALFDELQKNYELYDSISVPIQENLLQVMVFYDKIAVTESVQEPKVSDFQFVSDLGGSLGLWVGWSMLTVFEFMELGIDLLVLCCVKLRISQNDRRTHPQKIDVQQQMISTNHKY